jgi:hypothetical protein
MPDYSKGKIYKIKCNKTGKLYIGSTVQPLCHRKSVHIDDFKKFNRGVFHYMTSFEVIKGNDFKMELIENYPSQSVEELHERERFHIESNECVNKKIPGRTKKEYQNSYYLNIVKAKRQAQFTCDCGCVIKQHSKAYHLQSQKHKSKLLC